jgi:hypothetical protein
MGWDVAQHQVSCDRLRVAAVGCVAAPPGKVERPAQDKIKTDQ